MLKDGAIGKKTVAVTMLFPVPAVFCFSAGINSSPAIGRL